jgi:hypothetical protein
MLTDPQSLQKQANRDFRDLASEEFDTRTLLRNAAEQAVVRKYEDFLIVDTDSHHYETEAFKEIAEYIDDPVMRYEAIRAAASPRRPAPIRRSPAASPAIPSARTRRSRPPSTAI